MQKATLVYPHQIYKDSPALDRQNLIIIVEEDLFFKQFNFHAQKLILHRASMKLYEKFLQEKGFKTTYLESQVVPSTEDVFKYLKDQNIAEVNLCEVTDYLLERRINRFAEKYEIKVNMFESPQFYLSKNEVNSWIENNNRPKMQFFYQFMRRKFNILMDEKGNPEGGVFSFDRENRKKIPKGLKIPETPVFLSLEEELIIRESIKYVKENFPNSYGDFENFRYSISFDGAKKALDDFLKQRFELFGPYEDAILDNEDFLFHSVLSPYINIGLLTPQYVVYEAIEYAHKNNIQISSLEGFVRQILGWREFMRVMYEGYGTKMRRGNFFKHSKKLPQSFWQGKTGNLPVDNVINKVLKNAYCHHIERLMVMGNYMLLSEHDPNDVYLWFMEMFIDAYDWVMVPNVYGMSQFADGGIFATKPYISGSSYILKMSNFKKGEWADEWNKLFWSFLFKHEDFFIKNPRMNMLIKANKNKMKKLTS